MEIQVKSTQFRYIKENSSRFRPIVRAIILNNKIIQTQSKNEFNKIVYIPGKKLTIKIN